MSPPNRWQQEFPNAIESEVIAHIDGETYFAAVSRAVLTTSGKGHYVWILGWMMDVNPEKSSNPVYSDLLKSLEAAAQRGVQIVILIWNNPIYLKKAQELLIWASKLADKNDVIVEAYESTYGPEGPKPILRRFASIMNSIRENAQPGICYRPGFVSTTLGLLTSQGNPSLQELGLWVKRVNFSIGSHHEKNVFVSGKDGLIGFCGGTDFNVNRMRPLKSPDKHFYHDVAIEVKGPASLGILNKCIDRAEETHWGELHYKTLQELRNSAARTTSPPASINSRVQIVGTFNSPAINKKERSARDAYLALIRGAKKYIYIEDQYLVNIEVAHAINDRIKDNAFGFVMFVLQDSDETGDILIPNRKRLDFLNEVKRGISDRQKLERIHVTVINKEVGYLRKHGYHSGMHSKVLIVDDEIAMIGSCNVNNRSFTLDSETSAIVFGGDFARDLRINLWSHMIQPEIVLDSGNMAAFTDPGLFPEAVRDPRSTVKYPFDLLRSSYLKNYNLDGRYTVNKSDPNKLDIDEIVAKWIEDHPHKSRLIGFKDVEDLIRDIWTMGGRPQIPFSDIVDHPRRHVPALIDVIWDHIIDPKV